MGDQRSFHRLSAAYEAEYRALLERTALVARPGDAWTVFWPMIGHRYAGTLLVVGRALNGGSVRFDPATGSSEDAFSRVAAAARLASEGDGADPMDWITWSDGVQSRYNTNESAFWRVARRVRAGLLGDAVEWPRDLAWSNLAKVAPWDGGNPGGGALQVQREHGPTLLAREVAELAPMQVLVMTGRWWFEPFAVALGLVVDWSEGFVEGVADQSGRRWVVTPHPMTRPEEPIVAAVMGAFVGQSKQLGK